MSGLSSTIRIVWDKQPPMPLAGCWPRRIVRTTDGGEERQLPPYALSRRDQYSRNCTLAYIFWYRTVRMGEMKAALFPPSRRKGRSISESLLASLSRALRVTVPCEIRQHFAETPETAAVRAVRIFHAIP